MQCHRGSRAFPSLRAGPSESLRLVDGGSRCDGRVELSLHGAWGRVLDDQWDMNDASVVCRQLQCGEAERAYNPPKPERGTGPVGLRRVQCAGEETRLTLCDTSLPEAASPGVAEDVGVVCSGESLWRSPTCCAPQGREPLTAGVSPVCREPAGPAGERGRALCRESGDLLPGHLGDRLRRLLGPV